MARRDRETVTDTGSADLFGGRPEDHDGHYGSGPHPDESFEDGDFFDDDPHGDTVPDVYLSRRDSRRAEKHRRRRKRRNRRFMTLVSLLLVALIAVAAWLIGVPIYHYFNPADYSGQGYGTVSVVVHTNDTASDIAQTLVEDDVVASARAFTDAANADSRSTSIQPGTYTLHHHMSAEAALNLMLSPSTRVSSDIVVTPGETVADVERILTSQVCTASSPKGTVCGLGVSKTDAVKALEDVKELGLPTEYTSGGATPSSVEGFLYPSNVTVEGNTTATAALGQLISNFTDEVRKIDFTARAKALGITPYQELIIASIAQEEAKYPSDMAKVARVILNHLRAPQSSDLQYLRVDATSAYAAKLAGLDPTKTIYSQTKGPYNTYDNKGLPPTPIGNPGTDALKAAAHPPKGTWLYYVNIDAAGHLGFFTKYSDFEKAAAKCKAKGWGCG